MNIINRQWPHTNSNLSYFQYISGSLSVDCYWADGSTTVLKQKSLGQLTMVSDFIEEASTEFLWHDGKEARLMLEAQSEGHFDNVKYSKQVNVLIDILFESKYPRAQGFSLR